MPALAAPLVSPDWASRPLTIAQPTNLEHGGASEIAADLLQARASHKRVEVVGKRGVATTTYANPNGTLTEVVSAAPIRARNAAGKLVALDGSLVKLGDRLVPKALNAKASFRSIAGVPRATTGGLTASASTAEARDGTTPEVADLALSGAEDVQLGYGAALPAPTVSSDGDSADYAISNSSTLVSTPLDDGFSADVVLDSAPASAPVYGFPLTLAGGLTPKLADGVVKLVDESGKTVAESRALSMWDQTRDANGDFVPVPVASKLIQSGASWTLEMSPSESWLTDSARHYPVTIDPTFMTTNDADTWYYQGNTTDRGTDYRLLIGDIGGGPNVDRSWIAWGTASLTGRDITSATMSVYEYAASSCSPKTTVIYPSTNQPTLDSASNGVNTDSAWMQSQAWNLGGSGCAAAGFINVDVSKIIGAWKSGEVGENGMELRAGDETDRTYGKILCSRNPAPSGTGHCEGTSEAPSLSVSYVYDLGVQPHGGTLLTHRMNDHSQFSVNTNDGDGVYRSTDLHMSGRGLALQVDRIYNSLSTSTGQFGAGWDATVGADVRLVRDGTDDRWDYDSPSGTIYGEMVRHTSGDTNAFYTPSFGGLDADLEQTDSSHMQMTFHNSQEKYVFSNLGTAGTDMLLVQDIDRSGNTIAYTYDSSSRRLTSITDTHGRAFTIAYTSVGYISTITESNSWTSNPRTWTYRYNSSNQLNAYVDPTGAETDYGYTNGLLSSVQDPSQHSGQRPGIAISYSSGQTTGVAYTVGSSGQTDQFTYSYSSDSNAAATACGSDVTWNRFTTVTDVSDPQGGATKYCFQDRLHAPSPTSPNAATTGTEQIRVVDGMGHHRSSTYTPDLSAQTGTTQDGDGVTGGSTVYQYNTNNTLAQVTNPIDNSGDTAGATSFDYQTTGAAGATFLPSSSSTTGSSCTALGYDSTGRLTDTYGGQSSDTNGSCSGKTGGQHAHVTYNSDGTPNVAYSAGIAAKGSIAAGDETQYFYYSSEPNKGALQRVVRPGGSAACSSDRTGCTSYVYDDHGRVASFTDGNGSTTSYTYDKDDRVTQVLTGSASSCSLSSGSCVQYSYGAEGDLYQRQDKNGTTTFTYDWLNNPQQQTLPDGTVLVSTHDGAGNLTKFTQTLAGQSADSVSYAYDAGNELTSITDATGTFKYTTYDNEARPTKLTWPSSTGVSISYGYTGSGKVASIVPSASAMPSFTYSYGSGTADQQKLQKTTNRDGSTISYGYDSGDRLASASASSGTSYSYSYDADSNVRSATSGSSTTYYGYNENDQTCWSGGSDSSGAAYAQACAATPSGDTSYSSDKDGNNLGTSAGPITHSAQNQVTSIESPTGSGGAVSQTYFDQGNDLRRTAGSDTFTQGTTLGVTAKTTGSAVTYYTRTPSGVLLDEHGASGTYYYETDRLNSVVALVTTAGSVAGSYAYSPYGKPTITDGTSTTAAEASNWRWLGGWLDPVDGYYHLGARYYDDLGGKFTQADSVPGCIHRPEQYDSYAYAVGDPIGHADPSGRSSSGCAGAIVDETFSVIGEAAAGTTIGAAIILEPETVGVSTALGIVGVAGAVAGTYALVRTSTGLLEQCGS